MTHNTFEVIGDKVFIHGSGYRNGTTGVIGMIDYSDLPVVEDLLWTVHDHRYLYNRKTKTFLHNLIMKPQGNLEVDHLNHNGLDCTRRNMEIVTHAENCRRRRKRKDNTSGTIGVTYLKDCSSWLAYTWENNKFKYLGSYKNKEDAIYAREYYDKYKVKPTRDQVLGRN